MLLFRCGGGLPPGSFQAFCELEGVPSSGAVPVLEPGYKASRPVRHRCARFRSIFVRASFGSRAEAGSRGPVVAGLASKERCRAPRQLNRRWMSLRSRGYAAEVDAAAQSRLCVCADVVATRERLGGYVLRAFVHISVTVLAATSASFRSRRY